MLKIEELVWVVDLRYVTIQCPRNLETVFCWILRGMFSGDFFENTYIISLIYMMFEFTA